MESWRERGFVPDSDDEDAFESQEKGLASADNGVGEDEGSVILSGDGDVEEAELGEDENGNVKDKDNAEVGGERGPGIDDETDEQDMDLPSLVPNARAQPNEDQNNGNGVRVEIINGPRDENLDYEDMDGSQDAAAPVDEEIDLSMLEERPQTPNRDPDAKNGSDSTVNSGRRDEDTDSLREELSRTPHEDNAGGKSELESTAAKGKHSDQAEETASSQSLGELPATGANGPGSTPRPNPKPQRDFWDVPSSSPDLHLGHHPWRKQTSPAGSPTPKAKDTSQPVGLDQNDGSSPPTSPLSSVRSSILGDGSQQLPGELPNRVPEANQTLEELLQIPEDVLQELGIDQPARRSLRQRNPIQLHPYLLEDAKYQRLMKARGVKPVRIPQHELQRARAAAEESQGQILGDDAGSSSDTQMGYLPSSPIDTRELLSLLPIDEAAEKATRPPQRPKPATTDLRSPKRRRVIGPGDERPRQALRPVPRPAPPRVVIDNVSSLMPPPASSIFDMPSPPRSGSVSSPPVREEIGFRFPRGFSPPTITPRTETRRSTKDVDEEAINLNGPGYEHGLETDDAQTVRPASSDGHQASDEDDEVEEDPDEAAVRRYQRKIKGVLPASWLRLDQQKQKPPSATQRHNERMARLETEAAKGVARKITRKPDSSTPSSTRDHLSSLRHLADESDEENAENSDDTDDVDDVEGHRQLANMLGLDDSYLDQKLDGDIPEDNQIDYMFPTASRRSTEKRKRPRKDKDRSGDSSKKPRRKRQARLTDAIYGGQKQKKPSRNLPRLGILDAPDVTTQPRKEQPQFLRVAARKARSRHDRGRRSPSRKLIKLNSRLDTEDANASLRDWHAGRLKQTTLPRAPSQALRRQPLRDLSTNARAVFNNLSARKASERSKVATRPAVAARTNNTVRRDVPTEIAPPDANSSARDEPSRPVQQRQGNTWIIQRNRPVTSFSRNNPRPVVAEIESHGSAARTSSSLQVSLAHLGRDERLPLNRFLSDAAGPQQFPQATTNIERPKPALPKPPTEPRRRQLKKRPPKRFEVTHFEDYATPVFSSPDEGSQEHQRSGQPLHGRATGQLNRFRTAYSIDFDVSPLPGGLFFHESTFIGSGEFSCSLDIGKRNLDVGTSRFSLSIGDQRMEWGAWDDSVSSQLGAAFDHVLQSAVTGKVDGGATDLSSDTTDSGCATYRTLIRYVSDALSFIDPIDRTGFVTRVCGLVLKVVEDVSIMISNAEQDMKQLARVASQNVVFANQVCQIAQHPLVSQSIQDEALNMIKMATKQVVTLVSSSTGQAEVRRFLASSKQRDLREGGIKNDYPNVEAHVTLQHILQSTDRYKGWLEDLTQEAYAMPVTAGNSEKDIDSLESGWQRIFTTLPLQEFDALGILRVGSRFKGGQDNWAVIKRLLRPVFDSEANSESQPTSYYSYCRVLFHRCFILINGWGWRDCKPILDTLYDFFAKRTLYNFRLEENYKSPTFLDELDGNPSFEVFPGDPCFHILLKIIASGLRFLSKAYDKKKIRNYTWRLLPNHGRDYPKEQSIHQADLDALRNHHDLLCTLYSSVPDGCRPRLETIKALVHPATSHRETCKISLRTWARLARFKLSANEDLSGLEPFAEWHGYFVNEFLKQHNLARREIEAQNDGGKLFSQQLIDRTVAQNQRQIESLLKTALQGLQGAIKSAPTLEHARITVSQTPIKSILDLFNSRTPRLNATVSEGLQIITLYLQKCSPISTGAAAIGTELPSVSTEDDSQEYGDWSDIAAAYVCESESLPTPAGVEYVEQVFHPAVSRLVSNCFGEDRCPDDAILLNTVDCWTSVAHTLVTHGLRRWDSYISPYESDSWISLRWTTQTRKFTPQFLARCIEKDGKVFSECRVQILGLWMSALVERVSMLKFQHHFTEAILNEGAEDAVLKNLPFSRDAKDGRYSITFVEVNQRRLSLISSLLSNMRAHIQHLDDTRSVELSTTRHDYREIIQKMMSSMRSNYQELGNGEAEVQGAYVNFVHSIVGFLQQHSRDICPIDPFFTDPASFPLPSTDPTYIVARLKSYEPKLSSTKVAKTLIIFIQSVSERAALDGQQTYLVNQLYESMKDTYEGGNLEQPTLRATLLTGVFPAYLAAAFDNPAAWILSRPIMETTSRVLKELLFHIDATDPNCVRSILNIFSAVFGSSYTALLRIMTDTDMLKQPYVLITSAVFFDMIKATLPVVDYTDRLPTDPTAGETTKPLIAQLNAFRDFAQLIIPHIQQSPAPPLGLPIDITPLDTLQSYPPASDISTAATRELKAYINESWSQYQGKYYFTRRGGHQPQEVTIETPVSAMLDSRPDERLAATATSFLDALRKLDLLGDPDDESQLSGDPVHGQSHDLVSTWSDELLIL
ncbi:Mus7/MMS22 family-domain-containing protein [Aspergillus venezuelensis]